MRRDRIFGSDPSNFEGQRGLCSVLVIHVRLYDQQNLFAILCYGSMAMLFGLPVVHFRQMTKE